MANLKFLVVEDDLFYQTYVNDLLADSGVDIINAADGEAGLSMAVQEKPDLIITDIEIPKIQGFVLFKNLRERAETRDIPVIIMSGKVEKALLERHSRMSNHADGYLVKPFSGQALIDMIRDVIGEDFGFSEVVIDPSGEDTHGDTSVPPGEEAPEIAQYPEEVPEELQAGRETAEGLSVLVVDDSKYIRDVTEDFLEELQVRTYTAEDGEGGYRMASEILPDLILLDVQMPNMNGFVVCEMLRKQETTRNIPIILMSAVVDDESFQRHAKLRYHADAYLQKPFMKSELHELVRRFTSLGDSAAKDVESKTGFFVPTDDSADSVPSQEAPAVAVDAAAAGELEQARQELEEKSRREQELVAELESARKERDQLEAEVFELRKTAEGAQGGLQDKLTLATQRFEEARARAEQMDLENRELKARVEEGPDPEELRSRVDDLQQKLLEANEALAAKTAQAKELEEKAAEAQASEDLKGQITDLSARLQEASASVLDMENRNRLLEDELDELREREAAVREEVEQAAGSEEIQKEVESLKRDLTAARAAKSEIEEQAKSLLENRQDPEELEKLRQDLQEAQDENEDLVARILEAETRIKELEDKGSEGDEDRAGTEELRSRLEETQSLLDEERSAREALQKKLGEQSDDREGDLAAVREKLSAALEKAGKLEDERDNLAEKVKEVDELRSRVSELEKLSEELRAQDDESRKLAASETKHRMDLEGKLEEATARRDQLEKELAETRHRMADGEKAGDVIPDLEKRLSEEQKLREEAEGKAASLQEQLEEFSTLEEKAAKLEKENGELRKDLEEERKRIEELEDTVAEGMAATDEEEPGTGGDTRVDDRLTKLENALSRTVQEAQSILKEQQNRETELEESVEALTRSLEEERAAHGRERQEWSARESELKSSFEDALRESRRMMSEEVERLYPMHIPRRSPRLEVVTWKNRYGVAAAAVLAALALFGGGYLVRSFDGSRGTRAAAPVQDQAAALNPAKPLGNPPEPWIVRSGPEETYEELWRRNTVQSVSDDMMIQATLHTRDELQAAIKYTAAKEGWTEERTLKAIADMSRNYNLSESHYVTVYSKNLKGGYPGYAENFERHIALRDQSGKETRARLPRELEGSKFITSRVSAAGKEMNPVFLYEVGLTVAFDRKELSGKTPEGLQLILYDIGAVPMRVLTWDMSGIGSLS